MNNQISNLSTSELKSKYAEAVETIWDQKMEIIELKKELDEYIQAFEELQTELGAI